MAREATIRSSLTIRKNTLVYSSQPTSFIADVAGLKGPSPGAITATVYGTDIDLSELSTPGLCRIMNLDDTNFVEYGIWDPEKIIFYPLGEILPGETYILRLSRNLRVEFGVGSGTLDLGQGTNRLRFRAHNASCNVVVEAFEV